MNIRRTILAQLVVATSTTVTVLALLSMAPLLATGSAVEVPGEDSTRPALEGPITENEGRAEALLTTAAGPATAEDTTSLPNVILMVVDALRSDHVSAYGYGRQTTPNLDTLINDQGVRFSTEAAQAKLFAAEAAGFCVDRAMQIHSGYGYIGEFSIIEKLYRDQRVIEIYEGTSEIQRLIIGGTYLRMA